jgi:hypothetical protein
METEMFRKLALGLVAAGSLGMAAFAPTSASAYDNGPHFGGGHQGYRMHREGYGMHRGWHGWHGWRGARAEFGHRGCIQQRLVPTPWGPRYRPVNVCRY